MDLPVFVILILVVLVGTLLWIYEHPPKNSGRRSGRGGDFEE